MAKIILKLSFDNSTVETWECQADSFIETVLTVTPNKVFLPTLISTENIISFINEKGFELLNSEEAAKISTIVNLQYLSVPMSNWQDHNINIFVKKLSLSQTQYNEVKAIRKSVITSAHQVAYYENQNDFNSSKKVQDETLAVIEKSVKKQPSWWDKHRGDIYKFLLTTVIGTLVDAIIGIPLGRFVSAVIDSAFI